MNGFEKDLQIWWVPLLLVSFPSFLILFFLSFILISLIFFEVLQTNKIREQCRNDKETKSWDKEMDHHAWAEPTHWNAKTRWPFKAEPQRLKWAPKIQKLNLDFSSTISFPSSGKDYPTHKKTKGTFPLFKRCIWTNDKHVTFIFSRRLLVLKTIKHKQTALLVS